MAVNITITDEEWDELELISSVLKVPHEFTTDSQDPTNCPGDVLLFWMDTKRKIRKLKNDYSVQMIECIERREKGILSNKAFLAGCFLDPRTKNLLKP